MKSDCEYWQIKNDYLVFPFLSLSIGYSVQQIESFSVRLMLPVFFLR